EVVQRGSGRVIPDLERRVGCAEGADRVRGSGVVLARLLAQAEGVADEGDGPVRDLGEARDVLGVSRGRAQQDGEDGRAQDHGTRELSGRPGKNDPAVIRPRGSRAPPSSRAPCPMKGRSVHLASRPLRPDPDRARPGRRSSTPTLPGGAYDLTSKSGFLPDFASSVPAGPSRG